jgi:hypothetical protein
VSRPHEFETGELHYGIEHEAKVHKKYVVGPLSVADWFAMESHRKEATTDPGTHTRYALEALSRRLVELGDVPRAKLTPTFLQEHLQMPDLSLLVVAMGRLDERLESFRAAYEGGTATPDGDGHTDGLAS